MLRLFTRFFGSRDNRPALSSSFRDRMNIGYFIEYSTKYRGYLDGLKLDHEPDEIAVQMRCYRKVIRNKAEISKWAHPALLRKDELRIDNMEPLEREKTFFAAFEYAVAEPEIYRDTFNQLEILEAYLRTYGCPSDVKERILKAEIAGDIELAGLYRKFS